jgi:hypothetical protein
MCFGACLTVARGTVARGGLCFGKCRDPGSGRMME